MTLLICIIVFIAVPAYCEESISSQQPEETATATDNSNENTVEQLQANEEAITERLMFSELLPMQSEGIY